MLAGGDSEAGHANALIDLSAAPDSTIVLPRQWGGVDLGAGGVHAKKGGWGIGGGGILTLRGQCPS